MAPKDGIRCWVCGRTAEEVERSIGSPTVEPSEADKSLIRVNDQRARFYKVATDWGDGVPDQFKNMDFNFVMGNPSQFKALRFIDDVEQAQKTYIEPLVGISAHAKKGEELVVGEIKVKAEDARRRDILVRQLDEFEKRSGRPLAMLDGPKPRGFDGLKLADGLRYLRDIGVMYFVLQQKLLELDQEEEKKKLPTFGISMAKIKTFPRAVPLCTVCESLIKGL